MGAHLIFAFSRGRGGVYMIRDSIMTELKKKKLIHLNWLNFWSEVWRLNDGPLNDGGKKYFFKVLLFVAAQYMSSIYTRRSWNSVTQKYESWELPEKLKLCYDYNFFKTRRPTTWAIEYTIIVFLIGALLISVLLYYCFFYLM